MLGVICVFRLISTFYFQIADQNCLLSEKHQFCDLKFITSSSLFAIVVLHLSSYKGLKVTTMTDLG